jgi:two-component system chemotaxis response regulator CheB
VSVNPDIVVIGASAGGLEALQLLVAGLPLDFGAAVFVVVHTPPWYRSELPAILSRSGRIPAVHPIHQQLIEPGHIYIAPPDYHLLTQDSRIQLWRGPKENRHRPAINVLFRSAAVAYGERVIGIVLSGSLDDGAAGLWWIKKQGGIGVVQDPSDARFPDMPRAVLEHVEVDYVLPASEIGPLLGDLTAGSATTSPNLMSERVDEGRPR